MFPEAESRYGQRHARAATNPPRSSGVNGTDVRQQIPLFGDALATAAHPQRWISDGQFNRNSHSRNPGPKATTLSTIDELDGPTNFLDKALGEQLGPS